MASQELLYQSAVASAAEIRAKRLSPVELVRAVLERIERLNPRLNAFCTLLPEQALEAARRAEQAVQAVQRGEPLGPLHGIPFSAKDLVATAGVRTMRGSLAYAHDVPLEDAPAVARLKAAGAILLGKTCTPEFGCKGVTDSLLTGVTRNPWNPDLTPGGSSGGAAAQVAAGMGPLALGTDGGGSIRIPAAFCGIYGLKPSFGRVPAYPASAMDALSHSGPMTRTVADAALMLHVMAGPHEADRLSLEAPPADYPARLGAGVKGLRVAWSPDLGTIQADAEVVAVAAKAARTFEELGAHVEEVDPGLGDPFKMFVVFWMAGAAGQAGDLLPAWRDRMDTTLVKLVEGGLKLTAVELVKAQVERNATWDRMRRFFERYDLLLTPTMGLVAFKAGIEIRDALKEGPMDHRNWTPYTYPFNLTQNPAATVPAGVARGGLPVGLQIVGRRFADLTVLQASAAFEAARPWAQHQPSL
ncbi:MAG: amidase [Candidatus Lambdaproteobacteria bacterium]|nr:amidase [Candidatus Lambdaproteobacteria bacterium]